MPGFLQYEDNEVNYAEFGIETELRKLGLTYYKEHDGGEEYEAGKEYWAPGMEIPQTSVSIGGEEAINLYGLLEMITAIEKVSKNLKDLPLFINDEDDVVQHALKYYSSTPKRKAKPLDCLKAYVQRFVVPTFVPPFEVVEG